ncbi:TetR/AcrR family transcriptional regulator [Pseudomonas sp. GD03842]|uniref:TetR/AcrR family transcriptional regulator n=1 Tax=unclassified Pseudomonas TaxID=196821 RepID=UPI000D38D06B|nr:MULTISPECIES: TetR family transcriptional regulator [unclassified Pseudomonas]MDH0745655.1 TetR/AcrR family transcriptional regulator [Pseudomonas sp. GD03842]RAU45527.1 TetR family transcriptional regulator [Pseudomonas sp. RIT 409]RAU53090.1 TetR family transcriptional regulator [Pseudomonas sp. RIT 412]
MKKSKAETAQTRKRIVDVASREFKRTGIQATRVSDIMAAAGLTHGGFYRHFDSKEQLLAEACATAMQRIAEKASAAVGGGERGLADYFNDFLSLTQHDDCARSCTFVTMGSELARADEHTRHAISEGFRTWIDILARQAEEQGSTHARADAMFRLAAMIGAVTLARMLDDPELANEVLAQARQRLAEPAGNRPTAD